MQNEKVGTRSIKIALLLASSLTVMAGATIAPSLPQISRAFAHEPNALFLSKLMLTIPALFIAFGAPVAGAITDQFGRKRLLVSSMTLYALAGASGLYLNSLAAILAGRAVLGLAVAGVMTTSTTLVADYFTGDERSEFMGMQGGFMAMGGVLFVLLGGLLADLNWRYPFLVYLASLIFLIPALYFLYEPPYRSRPGSIGKAGAYPKRQILFIYLIGFVSMTLFYMGPVQLPFLLKQMGDISNTKVGMALAVSALSGAVVSINYQRVKARVSHPNIYAVAFLFMGTGYAMIALANQYTGVVMGLVISGLGFGLVMPNTSIWLVSVAPLALRGRVIGGLTTAIFLGQFFSPIIVQPIQQAASLQSAYGWAGGFMLVMALGFLLWNVYPNPKPVKSL
jgi:MFS family permease